MNCTEFNNILINVSDMADKSVDDNESNGLGLEQQQAFDAHRASCADCQASYEADIVLLTALRKMPVPEPSAGFADRVLLAAIAQGEAQGDVQREHKNGVQHAEHHRRHGFMLGFGSAAAAALALWVVIGVFPEAISPVGNVSDTVVATNSTLPANSAPAQTEGKPELSIALNQQRDIKLAFYSGESLKGAKITIRLPENVALVGYPGRRQLSWKTDLKKGDNLLRLPVMATQIARGELTADIEYEGRTKTLTLGLDTNASDTSTDDFKVDVFVG